MMRVSKCRDYLEASRSITCRRLRQRQLIYLRDTDKSQYYANQVQHRKIPKISPGAYIFSKALFERLIFGGAYIRRGLSREGNLRFKIDQASLKSWK